MSHTYRLIYKLERHPEGLKREQVPEGFGGCDAMFLASILYPEDGSLQVVFASADGRSPDPDSGLDDHEWFKVFSMLAYRLGMSKELEEGKREFCRSVFDVISTLIRDGKKGPPDA